MTNSIIEKIIMESELHPNKLCIIDANISLTYIQFKQKIVALANYFKKICPSTACIVVECTQDINFVIYAFAIQLSGNIFVPTEKGCSEERIISIIEDTNAPYYICNTVIHTSSTPLCMPTDLFPNEEWSYPLPKGNQTAEILYSTGTTGKSKGIVITHSSIVSIAENVIHGVEMKDSNVELIPLPLSHSHGLRRLYANMFNGSTVVLMDGITFIKQFFDNIDNYSVTSIDLAPSALDIILKISKTKLSNYSSQIDYIQLGGAPLKEESKKKLCTLLPNTRLYNFYGSTEAGCSCILNFNRENRPNCIGKPTIHSQFIVVDSEKNVIHSDFDHPGFLACKGSMNMEGYYKQPELTSQVMKDGYVYSTDVGYIDDDGYIYVLGREDDVINYCGIKIAPEEIEDVVLKIPEITDCACVPISDKLGGQIPKLYIVVKKDANTDEVIKLTSQFLTTNLDKNKIPRIIEPIDKIPRTYNGKILRRMLKQ